MKGSPMGRLIAKSPPSSACLTRPCNECRRRFRKSPISQCSRTRTCKKGFFEYDEFVALRAALPVELQTIVTFGYFTGWRKREMLNLTWDRVDLQTRTVRLEPGVTKNRDGRTIYLDGELFDTLVAVRHER